MEHSEPDSSEGGGGGGLSFTQPFEEGLRYDPRYTCFDFLFLVQTIMKNKMRLFFMMRGLLQSLRGC
jgi:hypothetical protein